MSNQLPLSIVPPVDEKQSLLSSSKNQHGASKEQTERNISSFSKVLSGSKTNFEHRKLIGSNKKMKNNMNRLYSILFGQFIALVASCMNASSYILEYNMNIYMPNFLLCITYLILFIIHYYYLRIQQQQQPQQQQHILKTLEITATAATKMTENEIDTTNRSIITTTTTSSSSMLSSEAPEEQQQKYSISPFFFLSSFVCGRDSKSKLNLRVPWWTYLCLSLLDVVSNYLTLLALNLTSLTSTTLLGSLTIPSTMFFCKLIMPNFKDFNAYHHIGVILCMVGGIITILSDNNNKISNSNDSDYYSTNDNSEPTTTTATTTSMMSLVGDACAIIAAIIYGITDAASEYWIKHIDRLEYLCMIGYFGCILTFVLSICFERSTILSLFHHHFLSSSSMFRYDDNNRSNNTIVSYDDDVIHNTAATTTSPYSSFSTYQVLFVIMLYIISLILYYVLATMFLKSSDATLLNLSLQTSNLWAILFSITIVHYYKPITPSFYLSVLLVVIGVFTYESCTTRTNTSDSGNNTNTSSQVDNKHFMDDKNIKTLFDDCNSTFSNTNEEDDGEQLSSSNSSTSEIETTAVSCSVTTNYEAI